MLTKEPLLIYNLFPRMIGTIGEWKKHISRISSLKFNWIYVNPFHYPGFSGSLYAPKDYFAFNPVFVPEGKDGFRMLKDFTAACEKKGIGAMMDLVINHSASDCILASLHPEWYRREPDGSLMHPFCVDPADTRKRTVWGDLAEIDNSAGAPHRDSLWSYWAELVLRYMDAGFRGFRADAAYKVPSQLWAFLIEKARKKDPHVVFFAETLGAEEHSLREVVSAGFDYVTNSVKWWDFKAPWCPQQYSMFRKYAPSVSFPESHDTERLFHETGGNEACQKMRYAFSAFFSGGVLMPAGYEWGYRKKTDVVHTMPGDHEEKAIDISGFIKKVNGVKLKNPVFSTDSDMDILSHADEDFFIMRKACPEQRALVVVNKNTEQARTLDLSRIRTVSEGQPTRKMIFPSAVPFSHVTNEHEAGEVRVFI